MGKNKSRSFLRELKFFFLFINFLAWCFPAFGDASLDGTNDMIRELADIQKGFETNPHGYLAEQQLAILIPKLKETTSIPQRFELMTRILAFHIRGNQNEEAVAMAERIEKEILSLLP